MSIKKDLHLKRSKVGSRYVISGSYTIKRSMYLNKDCVYALISLRALYIINQGAGLYFQLRGPKAHRGSLALPKSDSRVSWCRRSYKWGESQTEFHNARVNLSFSSHRISVACTPRHAPDEIDQQQRKLPTAASGYLPYLDPPANAT